MSKSLLFFCYQNKKVFIFGKKIVALQIFLFSFTEISVYVVKLNSLSSFPSLKFQAQFPRRCTQPALCYCHGDTQALRWNKKGKATQAIMWQGNSCNPLTERGKGWCRKSWVTWTVCYWLLYWSWHSEKWITRKSSCQWIKWAKTFLNISLAHPEQGGDHQKGLVY